MSTKLTDYGFLGRRSTAHTIPVRPVDEKRFAAWAKKAGKSRRQWANSLNFSGEAGRLLLVPGDNGDLAEILSGQADTADPAVAFDQAARLRSTLPAGAFHLDPAPKAGALAALGWGLEGYDFDKYKGRKTKRKDARLKLPAGVDTKRLAMLLEAVTLVRDLVNTPANDMGPDALEREARKLARSHKARISVIKGKALLQKGFPAIHAVGRAAAEAPRLIDIKWGSMKHPKVTLVGKGVCFDSGGLNIKSATGMRQMKKDMGGAAHVLGLASAVMAAKLKLRLRVLIPAVENAISANAYRPGDIIQTYKGLSVEIGNTDAEGRVVLADALALADAEKPELIIDFATLTGAARIALGADLPAMFTDDDKLAAALARAGQREVDPLWRMPLWSGYAGELDSQIADLGNIAGSSYGGSITAALFLQRFVENAGAWVHFDTFAWNLKTRPGRPKGGEAQGMRAAFHLLEERYG